TASRTVTWTEDTTPPAISSLPGPTTIECPATPSFATPTATDGCDSNPTLTYADVPTPSSCPQQYDVTRTWTAKDACGNTSTKSQTIHVVDTTAPVIAGVGTDKTIQCPSTPTFSTPTVNDACDPNAGQSLSFTDQTTPGQCGSYTVTRTWTAHDCSGNQAVPVSQTITVQCSQGQVCAVKFYDANANGVRDPGEVCISGWPITISGPSGPLSGLTNCATTLCFKSLNAGSYTVSEGSKSNWKSTTATTCQVDVSCSSDQTCTFGNLCLGGGGGLTMGFWSNKNGKAILCASDPAWRTLLNGLNLKNANGSDFDISLTVSCANADMALSNWLNSANATNMAYMLS